MKSIRLSHRVLTPLPYGGGGLGIDGENYPRWFSESYTINLVESRPRFLPELMPYLISELCLWSGTQWYEDGLVVQSTLAACCLASGEWNSIFTPILYKNIFLGGKQPSLSRSLLHDTFQHTQPAHQALVETIIIKPTADGSTANLLPLCFRFIFPNLRKVILEFQGIDPATIHPYFVHNLRSLSRRCTIQLTRDHDVPLFISWEPFLPWLSFIRHSRSTPCGFTVVTRGKSSIVFIFQNHSITHQDDILSSRTHFYIGKQEVTAFEYVGSSNIKQFRQHLTQTGNNLKGLYISCHGASGSLPGMHTHFLQPPSFSHTLLSD